MRPTSDTTIRRSLPLPDGGRPPQAGAIAKLAAFSPSIDAMNSVGSPEEAQAAFDASITQSAYQRFGSKFPDLVSRLITLRLLASDVEKGTAFASFIVDLGGRVVYIPAVVNDSRFEDLDIVYDKETDQFYPLTLAQLRYLRNRGDTAMGTAEKLPESVPTDMDIRSLMLPPETGRYSYASAPDGAVKAANLSYQRPQSALQHEVLRHLAQHAPEVFEHLPEEQRAAVLGEGEPTPLDPQLAPHLPHGQDGAVPGTIRLASADIEEGLRMMARKVASANRELAEKRASAPAPQKLLSFLTHSPNLVKVAFVEVLRKDRALASKVARFYGPEKIAAACRKRPEALGLLLSKRASVAEVPFRLAIAQKDDEVEAFGPDSGKALRGVRLRGYYYKTEGMPRSKAITEPTTKNVQVQRPSSGEAGAGGSGVMMLRKRDGSREPALVISQPLELAYGNAWDSRLVTQPRDTASRYGDNGGTLRGGELEHVPSHGRRSLLVFGNLDYVVIDDIAVFGDPVPASTLEGTALWRELEAIAKTGGRPKNGTGFFLSQNGAAIESTAPLRLDTVTTDSQGCVRGNLQCEGGYGSMRDFVCDPTAAINKMVNSNRYDTVYVPASWKWISLGTHKGALKDEFYLSANDAIADLTRAFVSNSERAQVLSDGFGGFTTSAKPGQGKTKVAALIDLSERYGLSGADAEALLKIAEYEGRVSALVVPRSGKLKHADAALEAAFGSTLDALQAQLEQIQGQISALTNVQQRAQQLAATDPMAMQQTDPGMGVPAPGDLPPAPAPAPMDAAPPAADPMAAGGAPPVDPAVPVDPAMAGGAPPAPAAPPVDPAAAGGAPPVDPMAAGGAPPAPMGAAPAPQAPPLPVDPVTGKPVDPETQLYVDPMSGAPQGGVMSTEGPAPTQIDEQVNPNYIAASGELDDAAIFDVGLLAEMQRAAAVSQSSAALEALLPINTKDLGETVDDLGRALLNLYLRGTSLNEQLGVQTRARMIGQIRRSFSGLGELLLDLRAYKAGARASNGIF